MKVLIVDDDQQMVFLLQTTLRRNGYTTCHTFTGEGALELLRTEKDIDVILLDIDLGAGIDGIEVARRMPRGMHLVIISGMDPDDIRSRANQTVRALEGAKVTLDKGDGFIMKLLKILQQLSVGSLPPQKPETD
jgi:DNA-binding response OmpR family regulator